MPSSDLERGDQTLAMLYQRAELHELAAERHLVLGDAEGGERERAIATAYWRAAERRQFEEHAPDFGDVRAAHPSAGGSGTSW